MTYRYNHQKVEKKWQAVWDKADIYRAVNFAKKKKYYCLVEFPYPSAAGLHVGHVRSYTAMDVIARKRRMQGYNVLYPIGWDAFGLPTENYAVKTGIHPAKVTKQNTDTFRRQLKALGFSFDWSREINTTDPAYYKWTQWIFLQFFKAGLAYKAAMPINWCPSCKIGLANEEVVGDKCERCDGRVEKRNKEQWMLKITAYADKLLAGLRQVDFLPEIKLQQTNWIGRSGGAEIDFRIKDTELKIKVFTTRIDTLFGATYLVLAPEHALLQSLKLKIQNWSEVEAYVKATENKTETARAEEYKDKTGVELQGIKAVNPASEEEVPVWLADYVLAAYGTGAIMAVPAHDERDFEFAARYNLPVREVVKPPAGNESAGKAYAGNGTLINSGRFSGLDTMMAAPIMTKEFGRSAVRYKLRDWIFSRQRYWGEPIPIIKCAACGYVPVSEKDLPLKLPRLKNYQPRADGESPLASVVAWVKTKCPHCRGSAKRETDVMPNWAGSSWYFLRYTDTQNKKVFANPARLKYWLGVDWYNGGMEHVTLHLLYSRFWNRFLYDRGLAPYPEPYQKRTTHGMILGEGGVKMSKSKGNVINPDTVVKMYGADVLRLYEMFLGPFNQAIAWDNYGIAGVNRFLHRVVALARSGKISRRSTPDSLDKILHKTIAKVSADMEAMAFNTAVSALMIFLNECQQSESIASRTWRQFLLLLAPFAPHLAEELWQEMANAAGGKKRKFTSVHVQKWPKYNSKFIKENTFTLVIQINGKVRDTMAVPVAISEAEARVLALTREKIRLVLGEKKPQRVIYIPGRLVNIVIKE